MISSHRLRAGLYHQLADLLQAGIPWRLVLERMESSPQGSRWQRRAVRELRRLADTSEVIERRPLPSWEQALLLASLQTGQILSALQSLEQENDQAWVARKRLLRASSYPLLVAHLAIVLLSIPAALQQGLGLAWGMAVIGQLLLLWGVLLGGGGIFLAWHAWARRSLWGEKALLLLPALGTWWRAAASARWARVLAWHFQAGGGILNGLPLAGAAAGSAGARSLSLRVAERVRSGHSLAEAAAPEDWLPPSVRQSLWLGEQHGRLAEELQQVARQLSEQAVNALGRAMTILGWMLYAGVVFLVAARILSWAWSYQRLLQEVLGW